MQRSQALQWKIGAAFAAVLIGFVGSVAYVPLALWPSGRRAEEIQHRYAESVRMVSELRGCTREARNAAVLAYLARWDASLDRVMEAAAAQAARQRCRAAMDRIDAAPIGDAALVAWRQYLAVDAPAQEAAADAVLRQATAARPDPAVLRDLFAAAHHGDALLETLVHTLAARAQEEAAGIHEGLRRLAAFYVGVATFGAAGLVALFLECVRLLRRYAHAAEERVATLDAFAAQVAHDLRGPLHGIQLTVGLIAGKAPDPTIERLATSAGRSVRRLDDMIRDLLQFARSGAARDGAAVADVSAIVRETCEELQPDMEGAGIEVTARVDPSARARVAPVALRTIVANLLENARKYRTPDQKNAVEVTTTCDERQVTLTVRDTGIGIPRRDLQRVFEPFVRGGGRGDGYGLGLATVKRLVEAHGGTIAVESEEGRGTTFVIRLPAAAGPSPAAGGGPDSSASGGRTSAGG